MYRRRTAVPGSFVRFIQREVDPDTGLIDLNFDSSNAQGIFKMTDSKAECKQP